MCPLWTLSKNTGFFYFLTEQKHPPELKRNVSCITQHLQMPCSLSNLHHCHEKEKPSHSFCMSSIARFLLLSHLSHLTCIYERTQKCFLKFSFIYHSKALSETEVLWMTLFIQSQVRRAPSTVNEYLGIEKLGALFSVPFIINLWT